MKRFTTSEYEKAKTAFLHKHGDWRVSTSPMNEYGEYHKDYICEDSAVWTELNRPVWREVEVEFEVCKCHMKKKVEVKLLETEGFNTDDGESMVCYEPF